MDGFQNDSSTVVDYMKHGAIIDHNSFVDPLQHFMARIASVIIIHVAPSGLFIITDIG